jgi:hypothetical protein
MAGRFQAPPRMSGSTKCYEYGYRRLFRSIEPLGSTVFGVECNEVPIDLELPQKKIQSGSTIGASTVREPQISVVYTNTTGARVL